MTKLERAIDDIRRKWVPDRRLGVFDIFLSPDRLSGVTSSRDALEALRLCARGAGLAEEVRLLPDGAVGTDRAAVVTAAVAPLLGEPLLAAPRVSEALHGECLGILERQGEWLRVRAADDYVAWIHRGYAAIGPADWARDWEERATARALSAELQTGTGQRRRLPTGARLALRRDGTVELGDGERAAVTSGAVRPESQLRVEARHLALPELAQKWFGGAPYLWGGRTEWGIDCSGLVQAVYAARGIRLPRDSDQQFGHGGGGAGGRRGAKSRSRTMERPTRQATCSSSPKGGACRTWRSGRARAASCTRPCHGAAWAAITCSVTSPACKGCAGTW